MDWSHWFNLLLSSGFSWKLLPCKQCWEGSETKSEGLFLRFIWTKVIKSSMFHHETGLHCEELLREVFCWKPNGMRIKDPVNFCVSQRESEQCAGGVIHFIFNRFHIFGWNTGQKEELKCTHSFALFVIASLFNQVTDVRFQSRLQGLKPPLTTFIILLSLSAIVSGPKTTHNTFSTMKNTC